MSDYKPTLRNNGQVSQQNIDELPEGNGFDEQLTDESNPLKQSVTVGRNGEQNNMEDLRTSQMKEDGHHLSEGKYQASPLSGDTHGDEQKPSGDPLKTTQQKRGEHKPPEGN